MLAVNKIRSVDDEEIKGFSDDEGTTIYMSPSVSGAFLESILKRVPKSKPKRGHKDLSLY